MTPRSFGAGDDGNEFEVLRATPPPRHTWFYLVTTARQLSTGQVEVRIFIDSRLIAERTFPGVLTRTTNDVHVSIGPSNPGGGEALRGDLDEVTIYKRALNETQVAALSKHCGL